MQKKDTFFEDNRLAILNACESNDANTVILLLTQEPKLIRAATKTKGFSLLHVAADKDNLTLCTLLLENGHETNCVDKEGQTPYHKAKSQDVKQCLAQAHLKFLCLKYFLASKNPRMSPCVVHSREKFAQFVFSLGEHAMASSAFALTRVNPTALIESSNNPCLTSYFREDILMTPYYGDLLVIHENEQALQNLEYVHQIDNGKLAPETFRKALITDHAYIECRAYLKFLSKGLELFSFLQEYPRKDDAPHIAEAKKMFITFGVAGFAAYYQQCTDDQITRLNQLPMFGEIISHAVKTVSKNNSAKNKAIAAEMQK